MFHFKFQNASKNEQNYVRCMRMIISLIIYVHGMTMIILLKYDALEKKKEKLKTNALTFCTNLLITDEFFKTAKNSKETNIRLKLS